MLAEAWYERNAGLIALVGIIGSAASLVALFAALIIFQLQKANRRFLYSVRVRKAYTRRFVPSEGERLRRLILAAQRKRFTKLRLTIIRVGRRFYFVRRWSLLKKGHLVFEHEYLIAVLIVNKGPAIIRPADYVGGQGIQIGLESEDFVFSSAALTISGPRSRAKPDVHLGRYDCSIGPLELDRNEFVRFTGQVKPRYGEVDAHDPPSPPKRRSSIEATVGLHSVPSMPKAMRYRPWRSRIRKLGDFEYNRIYRMSVDGELQETGLF